MNLLDKLGLGGARSDRRIDANTLAVTRTSPLGVTRTRELPIRADQWQTYMDGAYIQTALSHLSMADREFIMSGMTQDEWDDMYRDED